ncbi:MAG: GNAT family protein [Bacillota bacterium]|nr:GNAT family protein [Bacillota bacterium]
MRNLLVGDRIEINRIKDEDLNYIEYWLSSVDFLRKYDYIPAVPYSKKSLKDYIDYFESTNERYIFAIRDKDNNNIIGVTGFDEIVWSSNTAVFFIGIGDKNYIGKGLGKEALSLMLDFGFNELNFHRIQLNVISYNIPAIKLYESIGFIKEGVLREAVYRDFKWYDLYCYGILQKEWK